MQRSLLKLVVPPKSVFVGNISWDISFNLVFANANLLTMPHDHGCSSCVALRMHDRDTGKYGGLGRYKYDLLDFVLEADGPCANVGCNCVMRVAYRQAGWQAGWLALWAGKKRPVTQ